MVKLNHSLSKYINFWCHCGLHNFGDIADGKLKSFGSDGTTDDMANKIKDILEPLTQTVLGSNYDNVFYKNALVNEVGFSCGCS